MLDVKTSMFLDRSKVFKALDRKRQVVLLRTGGYTRKIMRNSMKRAPRAKGVVRAIDEDGRTVYIEPNGRMHDDRGRFLPVSHARKIVRRQRNASSSRPGTPPNYRKGTLRHKIAFGFDEKSQSVIVGTERFATKTRPAGGKTTAELINEGGAANITTPAGVTRASYAPRPFTPPAEAAGVVFFNQLIESTPLK